MTMPQAAGKKEGMQSKLELNRTKAADLRSIGNFNQANVPNTDTGLLLGTLEYDSTYSFSPDHQKYYSCQIASKYLKFKI